MSPILCTDTAAVTSTSERNPAATTIPMEPLEPCCEKEASRSLAKKRRVAVCDDCGRLVLGYPDPVDYERTIEELEGRGVPFQAGTAGKLRVIAYRR